MFYCCLIQHNLSFPRFCIVYFPHARSEFLVLKRYLRWPGRCCVLCRFQQACFLPEKRFCAKGSCRHSFAARPFRLHPPGCLLVVRNILIYAFRVSAFCLPSACEIRVSGAQKISTVARVKARYVACSKHVFSHRKCLMLKEAAG